MTKQDGIKQLLGSIDDERNRRLAGLQNPDPHAAVLWQRAVEEMNSEKERQRLEDAYTFAKNIQYNHVGLESDIYFSHPLRVAGISVIVDGAFQAESGIVGLLHNVLEVSHLTPGELEKSLGADIANQIGLLTVNRVIQWDREYKAEYYRQIMNAPRHVRVVKIIDKLDNLFLLGQNPDSNIRTMYLDEIEMFVLPMAIQTIPELASYMSALVVNHKEIYESGS